MTKSRILVVTGTGTDIGKTIATAAIASILGDAGVAVGLCKPVQTGLDPEASGDVDDAARLSGARTTSEFFRFPEPLAPETAARRAEMAPPTRDDLVARIEHFAAGVEVTLVEGAGGVLVRLGPDLTVVDISAELAARGHKVSAVVVNRAGLGTLSDTELTVDRLRDSGVDVAGTVVGMWPDQPDLAERCNLDDLPRLTGVPIIGKIPAHAGRLGPGDFRAAARTWLESGAADMLR